MAPRFLLATNNPGKVSELMDLLGDLPVEWKLPAHFPHLNLMVEESEDTCAENARLKAEASARACGLPTLADDSGLEVDALGGAPGVHSARFGGPGLSPRGRWRLLLEKLEGIPPAARTARFRCVMAIALPGGPTRLVEGACEGQIALAPAGEGGFGYDPVFYLPEWGLTLAQLPGSEKRRLSHRGQAARAARPIILEVIGARA